MAIIAAVVVGAVAVVTTAVNIGVGVHAANEQKDMQKKIAKEQKAQRARANFISQQGRAQMPSSMVRTAIKEKVAAIQSEQTGGAPPPQQAAGAPTGPGGGTSPGITVPAEPVETTPTGQGGGNGGGATVAASNDGSVDPSGMPILTTPVGDDDDDGPAAIPTTASQVDPAVSPNQVNYA
jgi:hypothetical protein